MRAGVLIFGDENTLMLHFGQQEVMALAQMVHNGETVLLPAMNLADMGRNFGAEVTHIQFVISPTEETFDAYMNETARMLGIEEVRQVDSYDPLNPGGTE